jgi:hypothetical protein
MAATIAEIREKLNRYSDSNSKVPHVYSPYQNSHYCNFDPFSQKKTKNSLDDIFDKVMKQYKSTHNRKYLQSLFPYYVFLDSIFDLDGKIVLKIHKERTGTNYSTRYVIEVTRSFFESYRPQIDNVYDRIGGTNINVDYRPRVIIHDTDDIFFIYNKDYSFKNIAQRKEFKEILLKHINSRFLHKKEIHLQGLPF